ncbi:MAG: hypothetical protein AW07_04133 [Candidatus Accumulibacter sp. SK-11]|nr:MAG: hypothetical protein AW07_04133 [Candidatus Accumulibacter sp. SK-11]
MMVQMRWVAFTVSGCSPCTCTRPVLAALKKLPMASLKALVRKRMTRAVVSEGMASMKPTPSVSSRPKRKSVRRSPSGSVSGKRARTKVSQR